jgi:hypothetical protein
MTADHVPDGEGHAGGQEGRGELAQPAEQHRPVGQLRHRGPADQSGDPGYHQRQLEVRHPEQEGAEREQRAHREGGERCRRRGPR